MLVGGEVCVDGEFDVFEWFVDGLYDEGVYGVYV